jgi:hypothetical protein
VPLSVSRVPPFLTAVPHTERVGTPYREQKEVDEETDNEVLKFWRRMMDCYRGKRRTTVPLRDLGSTLGTMVNGRAIGHHFMKDAEPLHRGEKKRRANFSGHALDHDRFKMNSSWSHALCFAASSIPKSLQLCSRTLVAEINSQELHLVRCYRKNFRKKTE